MRPVEGYLPTYPPNPSQIMGSGIFKLNTEVAALFLSLDGNYGCMHIYVYYGSFVNKMVTPDRPHHHDRYAVPEMGLAGDRTIAY